MEGFLGGFNRMKVQRRFRNMKIFGRTVESSRPHWGTQVLVSLLSLTLLFATWPQEAFAYQDQPADQSAPASSPGPAAAPYTQQTPEQLQQLVAPIALYP